MAVRPVGFEDDLVPARHAPPPGLITATALIVTGLWLGYLLGSSFGRTQAVKPGSSGERLAELQWEEWPPPRDATSWAVRDAVEIDGAVYVLVLDDVAASGSRSIWRSSADASWERVFLGFAPEAVLTDIASDDGALLVAGWVGEQPTIWRSDQPASADDAQWELTALTGNPSMPGDLRPESSTLEMTVNAADEIVVVADMEMTIDALADRLLADSESPNEALVGLPEVTVTGNDLWVRLTGRNDFDHVQIVEVDDKTRFEPFSGPVGNDAGVLRAWALWADSDGRSFERMTPPIGITGAPSITAFGDSFVASASNGQGGFELWHSSDGRRWDRLPTVPAECGQARPATASGNVLLAISERFDYVCTTTDGRNWEVQPSPSTATTRAFVFVAPGTDGGFVATVAKAHEQAILTTSNGREWSRITNDPIPTGGNSFLVGEQLVTFARSPSANGGVTWQAWVGAPLGSGT
jgi:hypothetical protein